MIVIVIVRVIVTIAIAILIVAVMVRVSVTRKVSKSEVIGFSHRTGIIGTITIIVQ